MAFSADANAAATGKKEDAGKGQTGQALDDAIEANSEAQDYNEETKPVKAQIVKEEPAVTIASGTGDLDTTGVPPCSHFPLVYQNQSMSKLSPSCFCWVSQGTSQPDIGSSRIWYVKLLIVSRNA